MRRRHRASLRWLVLVGLAGGLLLASSRSPAQPRPPPTPAEVVGAASDAVRAHPAWPVYERYCLACHGEAGEGHGPAAPWVWPAPRDFSLGLYKWRSTEVGQSPTRMDLQISILWGASGTSMHGFAGILDTAQVDGLIDLLPLFATGDAAWKPAEPTPRDVPPPPPANPSRGAALWQSLGCVACHGETGRGDGPAGAALRDAKGVLHPPYDLSTTPVRRPRGPNPARARGAIAASITYGLAGTAMPGYGGMLSDADAFALADHVLLLGANARLPAPTDITAEAIAADRTSKLKAGYWPGRPGADGTEIFGGTIREQRDWPAALAPAQRSLSSQQCARCHAKQVREWTGSLHAEASSPGLMAQLTRIDGGGFTSAEVESCLRCHAPLAEQNPRQRPGHRGGDDRDLTYGANPRFDAALQHEGLTCAACHVRHGERFGPPTRAPSLLPVTSYPLHERELYERADFCLPCHQLPARLAVDGKPLLNTYKEWLEGPYMKRGVQCQHCHMPNREHTFRGIHDPDTFRQGLDVDVRADRGADGRILVRASLRNVGAGHYLPTTPTPAAWLRLELVDGKGNVLGDQAFAQRIGRDIAYEGGAWREREDTRIPPGQARTVALDFTADKRATGVRVKVDVHPDAYYEGLYEKRLAGKPDAIARPLYEQALARGRANRYTAIDRIEPIAAPGVAP